MTAFIVSHSIYGHALSKDTGGYMRYLLIDRINEWKAGETIRGIKNIAMTEDFLEFHFPKNPIMPGVMLLEAMAQLTGWLEAASSDFQNWFLITNVHKCKFYGFALPGDRVELEVKYISGSENGKIYSGIGMVDGKKKITADFEGETIPFNEIEDIDEQKRFFKLLTREQ
jgi:3-hydroxyacyl-[acyl-carrier-protein] dehydratase